MELFFQHPKGSIIGRKVSTEQIIQISVRGFYLAEVLTFLVPRHGGDDVQDGGGGGVPRGVHLQPKED